MRGLLSAGIDPGRPYRLHPDVALREEAFGGLAYHHASRRLTFVADPALVDLVRSLERHRSLGAALEACAIPATRHRAVLAALAALAGSGVICGR